MAACMGSSAWKRLAAIAALGIVSTSAAFAQVNSGSQAKPSVVPATPPVEAPRASERVPLIQAPLTLADFPGMEPTPELRNQLGHVGGFIQAVPTDGAPATQKTEVWLGYTKSTLYVVFACFDDHPSLIRGHLARRENVGNDDSAAVILDPFGDRQRGLMFQLNPAGVQADAAWTDGSGPDYSFDQVWDSQSRVTDKGWMVLMAIPFRSLRYRPLGTEWGVVFMRNLPRNSETDYWPRVSAAIAGTMSQEGTLSGIRAPGESRNVQLNPYTIGQNEKILNTVDPNNPYFSQRAFEGTGGGEAKAVLKDAVVFDGTVNPDFSDVESDQPQFTVNQRYPVYFPELRPFFLENANFFSTPIGLLYTRNIIRPDYGLRVTGKLHRTNIGFLAVDDRQAGETVAAGDPLYGQKALFFVGRVQQDFGKGSNIGLMYTDEEFGGGWNRIGGLDFRWVASPHWTVLGQAVESSTHPSNPKSQATVFPNQYQAGPAFYFETDRSGHAFNMQSTTRDFSTGFQSEVGFIPTTDFYNNQTHATYQWYPSHRLAQSFGFEENNQIAFSHQDNRIYHYTSADPFVLLPRNTLIAPIIGENSDTVGPQNGYPITHNENFTENFGGLVVRGQPWAQLNFNIQAIRSGNVNYNPVSGGIPFLMNQETLQVLVSVNPLHQLTDDNTYLLDRDHSVKGGQLVYESQTFRTKLNYQFTRAWSARVIVEYDSTLANPLETSLARTKRIQAQALITWLPHPGTELYIGSNNDIQNYDHTLCTLADGTCDTTQPILPRGPNYLQDGRQFFVKASYLFRF
jgi:hypothetical protein